MFQTKKYIKNDESIKMNKYSILINKLVQLIMYETKLIIIYTTINQSKWINIR